MIENGHLPFKRSLLTSWRIVTRIPANFSREKIVRDKNWMRKRRKEDRKRGEKNLISENVLPCLHRGIGGSTLSFFLLFFFLFPDLPIFYFSFILETDRKSIEQKFDLSSEARRENRTVLPFSIYSPFFSQVLPVLECIKNSSSPAIRLEF